MNELKSLLEIAFEAARVRTPDYFGKPQTIEELSEGVRDQVAAIVTAVKAAVLARQPVSPAMGELTEMDVCKLWNECKTHAVVPEFDDWIREVRATFVRLSNRILSLRPAPPITQGVQLTEEETDRLASIAFDAWKESPVGADAFIPVVKAVLSARLSHSATPGYHVTTERPPTEADADATKQVLAFAETSWDCVHFKNVKPNSQWTHWMPQPPAPVSPIAAEDAAFEAFFPTVTSYYTTGDGKVAARKVFDAALTFAATQKPA